MRNQVSEQEGSSEPGLCRRVHAGKRDSGHGLRVQVHHKYKYRMMQYIWNLTNGLSTHVHKYKYRMMRHIWDLTNGLSTQVSNQHAGFVPDDGEAFLRHGVCFGWGSLPSHCKGTFGYWLRINVIYFMTLNVYVFQKGG